MVDGQFEPLVQPAPLRDRVYEVIEEMIITRVLQPGEHLVEGALAERLGVSRNPVREALNALQRSGWVELRPRQGAFVRQPDTDEVKGFFRVREVLEVEAARSVAREATEEDITRLRGLIEEGWAAVEAGDDQRLVTANSAFHQAMSSLTGNRVLEDLLAMLDKRLRWYFTPVVQERGSHSWLEHERLLEVIALGDSDATGEAMREHCARTAEAYMRQLRSADAAMG